MSHDELSRALYRYPDHFDWAYFQVAPEDQRVAHLDGHETIVLEGIHPDAPSVELDLPGVRGMGGAYLAGEGGPRGVVMHLDGLHLQPDERRCSVTCRGSLTLPDEESVRSVRVLAGVAAGGEALRLPERWPDGSSAR